MKVHDLLQGMLVQSAADAVLTLVDATAGSEAKFVERMNLEAARLGMTRTRFTNATGLSQSGHVTTARDFAVLARALLRGFPGGWRIFHKRSSPIRTSRITMATACCGSMPVSTAASRSHRAGHCPAASARRGDQRRIAVVLGASSDDARFQGALKLLNYGFENFDSVLLYRAGQPVKVAKLYRGERSSSVWGLCRTFICLCREARPTGSRRIS